MRRRSSVGNVLLPSVSVTLVSVPTTELMRESFGRLAGRVLDVEEDSGIWRPASMPTASQESHIQRAPMRGLMNHVSTVIDSLKVPYGATVADIAPPSRWWPPRRPTKNGPPNGKTRASPLMAQNVMSTP